MDKITSGTIEMSWDAEKRLAFIQFTTETQAIGKDALVLIEALTGWIGNEKQVFALLGDGARLAGLDAEYRSLWGKFFQEHREVCYIAFFNMGPIIRIAAEMFRIGTGIRMKAFADEREARTWLRAMGIAL